MTHCFPHALANQIVGFRAIEPMMNATVRCAVGMRNQAVAGFEGDALFYLFGSGDLTGSTCSRKG